MHQKRGIMRIRTEIHTKWWLEWGELGVFWGEILTGGENVKSRGEKGYIRARVPFPHP